MQSEEELRLILASSEKAGILSEENREIIEGVFQFSKRTARQIMVPRTDVVWIERSKTVRQALALALRSGFSRIPVIGENVDDVVGVVYLKDLIRRSQNTNDSRGPKVEELMRPGPLPDLVQGKADAPVTIIEYASMTCPHCAAYMDIPDPDDDWAGVDVGESEEADKGEEETEEKG